MFIMSEFKVGDVVTCAVFGLGKVSEVDKSHFYPVKVLFNSGEDESFTSDGRMFPTVNKSLFKGNLKLAIVPEALLRVAILPSGEWSEVGDASDIVFIDLTSEQIMTLCECSVNDVMRIREAESDEDVARILAGYAG